MEALVARASVVVSASRRAVWDALMMPDTISKIMPVVEVVSGWRLGRPFVCTIDMPGQRSGVHGVVHRIEPERLLEYEYAASSSRIGSAMHRQAPEASPNGMAYPERTPTSNAPTVSSARAMLQRTKDAKSVSAKMTIRMDASRLLAARKTWTLPLNTKLVHDG
jgi:uncharacterized protein YndB with AHSA1/START domain